MNRLLFRVVLGATLVAGSAFAALQKSGAAAVSFHAVGPGGLAIVGESTSLDVREENGSKVVFTSELNQLRTGIRLRDRHMREKYLETEKFPTATLRVDRAFIKFPKSGRVEGDFSGQMTIHGVTKPVSVHYVADGSGKTAKFDAKTAVDMTQFGVHVPSYLGVTVKPLVKIEVKVGLANP